MVTTKLRVLNPKSPDTKYTGSEPDWPVQPNEQARHAALIRAFSWYGYHYDKKTVKQLVLDWIRDNDADKHKIFAKVPESAMQNQLGWLCRMNQRGLELTSSEQSFIQSTVAQLIELFKEKPVIVTQEVSVPKINIQDRLRAKAEEVAGELEAMYDDLIANGSKISAEFKPMAVIRGMNLPAQMLPMIRDIWQSRLEELEQVQSGHDGDLVEGYNNFNKIQIRNLIKFVEQVLADCASYGQIKRVEKRPRKAKAVSPEHRARKFKHMVEFAELGLKGLPAAKLIDSGEAWLYDTKKRKLIHVLADSHVGSMTIKNNMLLGFDENQSQQKTLRKPMDTIKLINAANKPGARKVFKDVKTTETVFNGRGTDNLIILRVW